MPSHDLAVVMSVYNGERFLIRQLESIVEECPDIVFYIRDDGSTDKSEGLILSFFRDKPNIVHFYSSDGASLGPARSFWYLLPTSPRALYIFCLIKMMSGPKVRVGLLTSKLRNVEKVEEMGFVLLVFLTWWLQKGLSTYPNRFGNSKTQLLKEE